MNCDTTTDLNYVKRELRQIRIMTKMNYDRYEAHPVFKQFRSF